MTENFFKSAILWDKTPCNPLKTFKVEEQANHETGLSYRSKGMS
jgi:hypothetical protein